VSSWGSKLRKKRCSDEAVVGMFDRESPRRRLGQTRAPTGTSRHAAVVPQRDHAMAAGGAERPG